MRKIIRGLINTLMKTNCPALISLSLCSRVSHSPSMVLGTIYITVLYLLIIILCTCPNNSITVPISPVLSTVQVYEESSVSHLPNE